MSLPRLLVIGLGRRGDGDAAAGLLAAEGLVPLLADDADIVLHQGESTALIDLWNGYSAVVLLDASDVGLPPGTLSRYRGVAGSVPTRHLRPAPRESRSATAFELAQALGRLPPTLIVFGIEGAAFDPATPPSAALLAALPAAIERLYGEIRPQTAPATG